MKVFICIAALAAACCAMAQDGSLEHLDEAVSPVRIQVRHADPWMIKMLLEGTPVNQPEYSTLRGSAMSGARNQAGNGKGFFKHGHLVVNPTDNSIWYIPDKK